MDEPFPDLSDLSDDDLRELRLKLEREANEVSYRRRVLQGRIDLLLNEQANRERKEDRNGH